MIADQSPSTTPSDPKRNDVAAAGRVEDAYAEASSARSNLSHQMQEIMQFDCGKIDYELDRVSTLGRGLWSVVCLAHPIVKGRGSQRLAAAESIHEATAGQAQTVMSSPTAVFAVKLAERTDSRAVFEREARTLTWLQRHHDSQRYVVPFFGLDHRNSALVFEAVVGGSLEQLLDRLQHMTEVARHLELISVFNNIAIDLTNGLAFVHAAGVIHADVKPNNVLLDIIDRGDAGASVFRARFIDFSASFPVQDEYASAYAGGTWDYLAPEQLRTQREFATPTFASDVWSLGVTLLALIVGGSPYAAAAGSNVFLLREAIKGGDPLGFARIDRVVAKRMAACQNLIDGLRLALQKDRDRRATASAWAAWYHTQVSGP